METISGNRENFQALVHRASRLAAAGQWERAAVQAQIAARFAWTDHTGLFASQELEEVLGLIRQSVEPPPPRFLARTSNVRRVVHVATQVYGTGGHTQSIAHWIRQDQASRHELVVTRQGGSDVPDKIASCLPDSEALTLLDRMAGGLVHRAAVLRRMVASADVAVVHAHPHDVVPTLALGLPGLPPAVFVNHADHVFWQGTSAAGVVLCLRESGRDLAVNRRGVEAGRCVVANRPLELHGLTGPAATRRSALRSDLGARETDFVVVSAAAGSKYDPVGTDSLIGLFQAFLVERPGSRLIVAGPDPTGIWSRAAEATGGRIQALGRLPNISTLLGAADAYVDSFPFASLTSLLEAGSHGLPLVTFRGHPEDCAVLGSDSPGLDGLLLAPTGPAEFVSVLKMLSDSPSFRATRGAAVRKAIIDTHSPSAWQETVRGVYAAAGRAGSTPIVTGPTPWRNGPLDRMVAKVQLETGYAGMGAAVADSLPFLAAPERVSRWADLRVSQSLSPTQLLPDRFRCWLSDARRRFTPAS